jgi:hypothetical protein
MPDKDTMKRAQRDAREGKAPSTQAGEFVREEIHHVREGKHGARSAKQAIAIGLSKARKAGVKLPPRPGTRDKAEEASAGHKTSATRSRATRAALKKEPRAAGSHRALSAQAHKSATKRGPASRSAAAKKAAATRRHRGT